MDCSVLPDTAAQIQLHLLLLLLLLFQYSLAAWLAMLPHQALCSHTHRKCESDKGSCRC